MVNTCIFATSEKEQMTKILVTYALEEERVNLKKEGILFTYCKTSVGKVDAAIAVQQAIYQNKPDLVLNIGTSGSVHHPMGSIHLSQTFVDRDMEKLVEFGLKCREDFSSENKNMEFLNAWNFSSIVNSGDTFLTSSDGTGDVFDMEAYAIARVCKTLNLPFASIKYVTDIIGENSVKHWEDKLSEAQEGLQNFVDAL